MTAYTTTYPTFARGVSGRTEPFAKSGRPHCHNFDSSVLGFPASLYFQPGGEPIRQITNGRRSRPVGRYYSIKNGRAIPWESRNELHAFYHAEVSPSVVSYRAQPHTLHLVINGVSRFYTPDREEELATGQRHVVEVKDEFEAESDPDYGTKIEYARAVYRLSGKLFSIQERAQIEAQPLFDAVEAIQRFRRTAVTHQDIFVIREMFAGNEVLPLLTVRDAFKSVPLGFAKLSAMMVRRVLVLDLTHKLGPDTPVRILNGH